MSLAVTLSTFICRIGLLQLDFFQLRRSGSRTTLYPTPPVTLRSVYKRNIFTVAILVVFSKMWFFNGRIIEYAECVASMICFVPRALLGCDNFSPQYWWVILSFNINLTEHVSCFVLIKQLFALRVCIYPSDNRVSMETKIAGLVARENRLRAVSIMIEYVIT